MKKEEVLGRLAESRAMLLATIAALSEEQLWHAPAVGVWPARDALAHIAGWAAWDTRNLRAALAGAPIEADAIMDFDRFNRQSLEERAGWSVEQILAEMAQQRAALLELLEGLSDEDLTLPGVFVGPYWKTLAGWLSIEPEHEEEHAAEISGRRWEAVGRGLEESTD